MMVQYPSKHLFVCYSLSWDSGIISRGSSYFLFPSPSTLTYYPDSFADFRYINHNCYQHRILLIKKTPKNKNQTILGIV